MSNMLILSDSVSSITVTRNLFLRMIFTCLTLPQPPPSPSDTTNPLYRPQSKPGFPHPHYGIRQQRPRGLRASLKPHGQKDALLNKASKEREALGGSGLRGSEIEVHCSNEARGPFGWEMFSFWPAICFQGVMYVSSYGGWGLKA